MPESVLSYTQFFVHILTYSEASRSTVRYDELAGSILNQVVFNGYPILRTDLAETLIDTLMEGTKFWRITKFLAYTCRIYAVIALCILCPRVHLSQSLISRLHSGCCQQYSALLKGFWL